MTVGWYLESDGSTHRLHDAAGWSDVVLPDEVITPQSWQGTSLGSFEAEALETAIRYAGRVVNSDSTNGLEAAGYELRVGLSATGRSCITVSAQGFGVWSHSSFEVPIAGDFHGSFTCLIAAEEAEKLTKLPYGVMQLWLSASDTWELELSARDDSGTSWAQISCSRLGAPGTWELHRASQLQGGAVLYSHELRTALKRFSTRFFHLRLDRYGLSIAPFKDGAAGTSEHVSTLLVSDSTVEGVFNRTNINLFAAKLESATDQIELKVLRNRQASYLTMSMYPAAQPTGWYSQKEGDY